MIFFSHSYDRFNNIWEAAAAPATLLHSMVDLGRNNQLPAIFIQHLDDSIFDLFGSNYIAMAD